MAAYGVHAPYPGPCKSCGQENYYDNRVEVDQKLLNGQAIGPDWKCKQCGERYFRDGSYPYNQALKGGGPPPPTSTQPPTQYVPQGPPHPYPPMHIPPES